MSDENGNAQVEENIDPISVKSILALQKINKHNESVRLLFNGLLQKYKNEYNRLEEGRAKDGYKEVIDALADMVQRCEQSEELLVRLMQSVLVTIQPVKE